MKEFNKSIKSLLVSQACGAFNDNFFKTFLMLFITANAVASERSFYISLTGALLIIPFIIFSPLAGFIGDKFSKKKVSVATRLVEPFIVLAGSYFVFIENIYGMFTVLFCFGIQSTIFSPSKYGIIPELVEHKLLSKTNAWLELLTFMAILGGTVVASQIEIFPPAIAKYIMVGTLLAVSISGFIISLGIKTTPVASKHAKFPLNPFSTFFSAFNEIKKNRNLFLVMFGTAWFWFIGALFQLSVFVYAGEILGINSTYMTGLLVSFLTIGIGVGSIFAGKVSGGKVELGLVPIAAFGMSIVCLLLALFTKTFFVASLLMPALGFFAGMYIVPLNAYFQEKSPKDRRGKFIASSNLLTNLFILLASVVLGVLNSILGIKTDMIFLLLSLLTIALSFLAIRLMPQMLIRCINWIITNTFYSIKCINIENIPEKKGALLVCNHVTYVDALLLLAATERNIRFIMYKPIYNLPVINFFAKAMGAIPIDQKEGRKGIENTLNIAREAVKNGELVCIFAEGELSRTGNMVKFRRGFESIMQGLDEAIVPVYLDQIWGSIFSFKGGKFVGKLPKIIPYPVTINIGEPLSANSTAFKVRQKVCELGADSFQYRSVYQERLDYKLISCLSDYSERKLFADSSGKEISGRQALVLILALRKIFLKKDLSSKKIGIILPPGIGGVLANFSVLISNKVPVNLNYTASESAFKSAINQCDIKEIITSKKFLEKVKVKPEGKLYFIEDLLSEISFSHKLSAYLMSYLPKKFLQRVLLEKNKNEDLLTVIFSSGSSGEPKGIMLSHANILSNIEGLTQVFDLKQDDCMLGVLPFFHSFGFTVSLFMPLMSGIKVVYHFNPLDARMIGKLAEKHSSTMLLATPTFLSAYLKKCTPEQFSKLRAVVCGAEKMKSSLAEEFKEKFGILPLEGYGCTELSPVVALNIPDVKDGTVKQKGQKQGKVGQPLPNIAIRIVDPETKKDLDVDEEGLILVKGPNVMKGYLGKEELTKKLIIDGWYETGDIGSLDSDGFLQITDRLSRFSKIAGEMVPHVKIEEELHKALNISETILAVTSVEDEKKGEKLIVIHTIDLNTAEINKKLKEAGLPNLWIPDKKSYIKIDELPILGSGKLDLKSLKKIGVHLSI